MRLPAEPTEEGFDGVLTPSFVERARPCAWSVGRWPRFDGVLTPSFVERSARPRPPPRPRDHASTGYLPRPSLSGGLAMGAPPGRRVPASTGYLPRPSLSEARPLPDGQHVSLDASTGYLPRPSLSELVFGPGGAGERRFDGVLTPSFVERANGILCTPCPSCFDGVLTRTCGPSCSPPPPGRAPG